MANGWQNSRLETTYPEARSVIEEQRFVISDIDAKAMYTVRVVVVLAGVVVAAVQIGGPDVFHSPLLSMGLGSLLLSLCLGVMTYAESSLFLGPNRAYVRQLVEDDVDAQSWEIDLTLRMSDWMCENDRTLQRNARLLFLTQLSLLGGVAILAGAVAL